MLDLELPTIPSRSRLYSIEPIGLGTAEVESLTSYLTRLANVHRVSVNKLAQMEFAAVLNKSEPYAFARFDTKTLNGINGWTGLTIEALEILTERNDFCFLTMYPWRHALAHIKLLRYHLAWCPVCYNEWWQSDQAIYHPLLWSLDVVQICLRHQQPLSHHCPHPDCRKSLPLLLNKGKLGYCPSCQRRFGDGPVAAPENVWDESEWQWHIWITTQLGELLMATPNLPTLPQRHMIAENIKAWLQTSSAPENMRQLARQVGVTSNKLWSWMKRDNLPELSALAQVCYHLDLSILDILTTHPVGGNHQSRARHKIDAHLLSRQLEDVLRNEQEPPLPAHRVAQQLGVSNNALRNHCPEQYQLIFERFQQYQQAQRQQRNEKLEHDLRTCLESDEFPPPPLAEVARRLQIESDMVWYICPELSRLISQKYKAYQKNRRLKIEVELKRILATTTEPPPSVTEVANSLGETRGYIHKLFPELCRAIAQRYRSYKPKVDQNSSGLKRNSGPRPTDHHHCHKQFVAIIAAEEKPPPQLTEVARRIGCTDNYLRYYHPDLCHQLRQQLAAYTQTLEDKIREILAQNVNPPPSLRQVAQQLEVSSFMLQYRLPELSAEILQRFQLYRQTERQRRKAFLDQTLAENPTPFPSLSQVAKSLNCTPGSLSTQFPEACQMIKERYQAYLKEKRMLIKETLEAILADRQNPPPPLIKIAQQLGYQSTYALKHNFPDLCHQIHQRSYADRRQTLRSELVAILANSDHQPPPSLDEISLRLGCSTSTLAYLFPDLYRAVVTKRQNHFVRRKLALEQALKDALADEGNSPISLTTIAKEFGTAPDQVRRYFPDLAAAVREKYKTQLKERSQQRQQKLIEDVKHITRQMYHEGIDPNLAQLSRRLPSSKMIVEPFIREAWREARQELGLQD
jgi:AraC-like DNA-binding protein